MSRNSKISRRIVQRTLNSYVKTLNSQASIDGLRFSDRRPGMLGRQKTITYDIAEELLNNIGSMLIRPTKVPAILIECLPVSPSIIDIVFEDQGIPTKFDSKRVVAVIGRLSASVYWMGASTTIYRYKTVESRQPTDKNHHEQPKRTDECVTTNT